MFAIVFENLRSPISLWGIWQCLRVLIRLIVLVICVLLLHVNGYWYWHYLTVLCP